MVELQGSVANVDFMVKLADERLVVVKVGPAAEMKAEAWACRLLAGSDVPVAEVLGLEVGYGPSGSAIVILSHLPGEPSQDPVVMHQAGRAMRRVHAEHLPGWGSLVVDDIGMDPRVRGEHQSWRDAVLAKTSGLTSLVDAGIIGIELADAARSSVEVEDLLGYDGPGVLLHNDLKPAHLFALGQAAQTQLTGIIDWGDASAGDPLSDLARLSKSGPAATNAFLAGYGMEPTPGLDMVLARYRVLGDVAALTYEHRAGGDWFDVYRDRIKTDTMNIAAR